MKLKFSWLLPSIAMLSLATVASASTPIRVDYEVNHSATGTGLAPLAGVFHDGSFSSFTSGTMASDGLEALAETGNPSPFLAQAPLSANTGNTDGQIGGTNRPVKRSFTVSVDDGNGNFSYASMFLPSNDWFIANPGGTSFDASSLLGASPGASLIIDISSIYDAGTELEDFTRGGGTGVDPFGLAPRLSDADGGDPNDQMDNISLVTRTAGVNLFESFVNPNSEPIGRFLGASNANLGTITLTVVPEPTSAMVLFTAWSGLSFDKTPTQKSSMISVKVPLLLGKGL